MEEEEKEKEDVDQTWRDFPYWSAARRKFAPDCCFFSAGNLERELQAKQVSLSITDEEKAAISRLEEEETLQVRCPIVGCGATLSSLSDFESHYTVGHRATCSVCSNVYPTTRLLNIHISECHDSFFKAKVARNYPMYECLVEGCPGRFQTDGRRLQHLVDLHRFPKTFRFHSKKHFSQKHRRRQKQHAYKQPQSSSTPKKSESSKAMQENNTSSMAICEEPVPEKSFHSGTEPSETSADMDVDSLTKAVSSTYWEAARAGSCSSTPLLPSSPKLGALGIRPRILNIC
ncbi:hypothetical protein Mapa_002048 [Marchantia paleacea]|nr:hypothetical protein Mapa_002048 [Marchantia paleacea]